MAQDDQPAEQQAGGTPEPPAPDAKEDKAPDPGRASRTQSERKAVYNTFLGSVNAGGSVLGFGENSGGDGESARSATGRLGDSAIDAAAHCYVAPGDPYGQAHAALLDDHVVALVGGAGIGKRTATIVLLSKVLGGDRPPIVALAPSLSLEDLRKRDYERGYGYAVFDRTGDRRRSPASKTGLSWADDDHAWQAVVDKVYEAGAYLVVTAGPTPGRPPEAVRHVAWQRPDTTDLLSARLGDDADEAVVRDLVALLPGECAMADLTAIAELVVGGSEPADAVNKVLDQSGQREVRLWFAREPTRREVLDVTTLAFVTGVGDRAFEICRDLLEESLAEAWPPPPPDKKVKESHLRQDRAERFGEGGLIRYTRDNDSGRPHRMLAFREDSYRRYVLEELSERFKSAFWDAVKSWLDRLMVWQEFSVDVGAGLALLSYTSFDEIDYSYLSPGPRARAAGKARSRPRSCCGSCRWTKRWDRWRCARWRRGPGRAARHSA
ncbi:hypothetical protein [Nonomuraea sp. SBT364]|uniref:hypothetical protein n=1 Tax=Nonomuraea sp. SBT364 TaxID=1580530 RepID=UPI00066AAD9B|nr:hypothetical protein [Nonomuraea sp. SBT364]